MKFQIISDIHLEFLNKIPEINPIAPNLLLLGDIGLPVLVDSKKKNKYIYKDFIKYVSLKYEKVFLILGNHEYYNIYTTMKGIQTYVQDICNETPNVYLMDNRYLQFEDIHILGSTLWSNISINNSYSLEYMINDYHMINTNTGVLRVKDTNELHDIAVKFLKDKIEYIKTNFPNDKILVLTHHAPYNKGTSNPEYEKDTNRSVNQAFATDLSDMINTPIHSWAFGHTHYACNFKLNNVNIISNPMGYGDEKTGYDKNFVLDLSS